MCASSKKGFSAHQLHRQLGCQYNTAWFLHHRVMEAMRRGGLEPPLGGEDKVVEADETYFGRNDQPVPLKTARATPYLKTGWKNKGKTRAIVALVERGGDVRTFHVAHADKETVGGIVASNILRESRLPTDESRLYTEVGQRFAAHETVKHSAGEYVRGDVHSNTAENYFSIFKRGMKGVYQHCKKKNLHRYLAEFDFRYNSCAVSALASKTPTKVCLNTRLSPPRSPRSCFGAKPSLAIKWIDARGPVIFLAEHMIDMLASPITDVAFDAASDNYRTNFKRGP